MNNNVNDAYCPMIHNGLAIDTRHFKDPDQNTRINSISVSPCCLRKFTPVASDSRLWPMYSFDELKRNNLEGKWDPGCQTCLSNEKAGHTSFRTGMLELLGHNTDCTTPRRIDLIFDSSCNLACRTCTPVSSTFWQKHLLDNNLPTLEILDGGVETMILKLKELDLSNLEMVVLCGGETLLGRTYWNVVQLISELVPNAKQQLTVCMQTNGTQPIPEKYHELIDKFKLFKLHISLDGVSSRFEYLRWPAKWDQFCNNIFTIRETAPSNVMMLLEETISVFNWYYLNETETWAGTNYATNREGDPVNLSRHMAKGITNITSVTKEYTEAMPVTLRNMLPGNWVENPQAIQSLIKLIQKFDCIRNEDWTKTFPEVASFYHRYL